MNTGILTSGTLFIALLLSASSMAGNFYKWTDDKGVVHYSQRAPEGQAEKTETVKTYNTRNTGIQSNLAGTSGEDEAATTEEAAPEEVKKDKALCERAKKDQATLKSRPIVRQNGKVMTIDQKNQQIKDLQEIINVHC